jgi:hypothetical protein
MVLLASTYAIPARATDFIADWSTIQKPAAPTLPPAHGWRWSTSDHKVADRDAKRHD